MPATLVWIVVATLPHRHAEHGGLRPIDADGDLGPAFFAADAHVGDAGRVLHHAARVLRDAARVVEVVAADFELQAARAALLLLPPPPRNRMIWKLPPAGLARTTTPGRPGSCAPQGDRDLLVGARALIARHEHDADLAAVGAAAAATAAAAVVVAAAAAVGDDGHGFGHVLA